VAELKELRVLTSDENGAQRVVFTNTWARRWMRSDAFGGSIGTLLPITS
jgi:hypothetical protein